MVLFLHDRRQSEGTQFFAQNEAIRVLCLWESRAAGPQLKVIAFGLLLVNDFRGEKRTVAVFCFTLCLLPRSCKNTSNDIALFNQKKEPQESRPSSARLRATGGGGGVKPHHTAPSSGSKSKSRTALPTALSHKRD